jgi:hypothetical protein
VIPSLATIFQPTQEPTLFQVNTPKTQRQLTDLNKTQTKFKHPRAISKLSLLTNHRLRHKIKWLRLMRKLQPHQTQML